MIGRRLFLTGSAAVVTTIAAHRGGPAAAEPPPETTRVRLGAVPSICLSPQ